MEKNINVYCTFCGKEISMDPLHYCKERGEHVIKKNIWDYRKKGENMLTDGGSNTRVSDKNEEEIELTESQLDIIRTMDSMKEFLLEKNRRYGDSALHPKRMFSKATTDEQILVRLDDKISRIQNSDELRKNDIADMIGYLALLCVAKQWVDFKDLLD
jgi:hypothetical protein